MGKSTETNQKSLLYRATHRSTKEADRILGGFAKKYLNQLDDQERLSFQEILAQDDPQIFDWLRHPETLPDEFSRSLWSKIVAFQNSFRSEAGYSLVEISIALGIVGLMIGGVLKGQQLYESAQLKSILSQVHQFRLAAAVYMDKNGHLPLVNNTTDNKDEAFWQELSDEGLVTLAEEKKYPTSKLGGRFSLVSEGNKYWFVLSNEDGDEGILTPDQAKRLIRQGGSGSPTRGTIQARGDQCLAEGKFKESKKPVCKVQFQL